MNPLIFRKGVCDPHIHIFEGKAYLYATHDSPGYTEGFHMEDWQVWASEDLIDWKLENTVRPEEFYCGGLNQCWAVDAAYKDGKYYLYFSTGDWGVGVAVSEHPGGPFRDVLGHALADYRVYPYGIPKWDPCVFQDDDGRAYLIVGTCKQEKPWDCYLIARLTEDMIHLAEPFQRIEYAGNPCPEDKPSIHKYNGRYYLTHSSYVAVSDTVYGPYRYQGNTGCNIDHGSFFTYRNQTYFASGGMDNPNRYLRASFLAPCHYRENGEIVVEQKTMEYGCGAYDANWDRILASWYFEASKECKRESEDGGFSVFLEKGDYVCFPNIANVEEDSLISVCASAVEEDQSKRGLLVLDDSLGTEILGRIRIGGQKRIYQGELHCSHGQKSLCLMAEKSMELCWFSLGEQKRRSTLLPALSIVGRGASLTEDRNGANHQVLQNMELRGAFLEGLADGGDGGEGLLRIPYFCTGEETGLKVYVNGSFQGEARFPVTARRELTSSPKERRVPVILRKGLNRIRLASEEYQAGQLAIAQVTVEAEDSVSRVYAAANGSLNPAGNGCWDGLPQRETEIGAYGGRLVKYLGKPKDQVILEEVDGGEGGRFLLEIHYCRGEQGSSSYRLLVNGKDQGQLKFPYTGGFSVYEMEDLCGEVSLQPGKNQVVLEKEGIQDEGIYVDAFALRQV